MKKKFRKLHKDTSSEKMTTLSSAINQASAKGYILNFKIHDNGMLWDGNDIYYNPEEIIIDNFYRFEGESDPGDSAILYLLSTADGSMGLLVDGYGAYDDAQVSEFVRKVTSIQKQKHEHVAATKSFVAMACYIGAGLLITGGVIVFKKLIYDKKYCYQCS